MEWSRKTFRSGDGINLMCNILFRLNTTQNRHVPFTMLLSYSQVIVVLENVSSKKK